MTYETALKKIHSLLTFGSRPGLDRMREFLRRLGDPQNRLKYIHVAGTNGKGSTCAVLSSILTAAGYKTGLFISPYITDFRERIQINNRMISKKALTEAVEATFPVLEELRAEGIVITEFEYVNALQFYWHAKEKCDVVVLETGMGGLLDCTNVIEPPLCAVITAIGLDHTAILGDTIAKIAAQKCGIVKSDSAVVTAPQEPEAMEVIEATAREKGAALLKSANLPIKIKEMTLAGSRFTLEGEEYFLRLAGRHQIENAANALTALFYLRNKGLLSFNTEHVRRGLAAAVNPARLELFGENPPVLLDGAHNPNGIAALERALEDFLPDAPVTCVMGMLADKDIDSAIALLDGVFMRVHTVPVDNPRAISSAALAEKFRRHCPEVVSFDSAEEGFDEAFALAKKQNAAVLICGSLYLAGEIRPYILNKI